MSVSNAIGILDIGAKISDAAATEFSILQGDTTDTTNYDLVYKLATGETTKPLGIIQETTDEADVLATVRKMGISRCRVDGSGTAIDVGTSIVASSDGIGKSSSTPDAAQQWAIGFAEGVSSASGDIIDVFISPHLIVKGTG